MLDLAKHIVNQKTSEFEPEKFEDHYEEALTELINAKRNGKTIAANPSSRIRGFLSSPFQINQWLRLKGLHYGG